VGTWVVVGLVVAVLLAWYLSFSASRLDRLHHRVEGARAMLDAQLVRRAEAAIELATSGLLDPASGLLVAGAASDALQAGEHEPPPEDRGPDSTGAGAGAGDGEAGRESAESDLSRALDVALGDDSVAYARRTGLGLQLLERLQSVCHRVQLARRFHNQAVSDAQRVRRKRIVRWAHLAGRAALPETFEMDDDPPAALTR
jgi:hypothetical protein